MDEKKLAAVTAAVFAQIKTGEEAQAAQLAVEAQAASAACTSRQPVSMANTWGLSGRQAIMQANTMMQLRMFK